MHGNIELASPRRVTPNDRHTENGRIGKSMNKVPEWTGILAVHGACENTF
ncbi:hypothetical protein [Bacteroides acidifaciens]|nr:hypothetical protein [Bacteroides acidifaciens]